MEKKVLVIVESPTKARTIKRILPSNYIVEASIGHVRDLPQTAADIPKSYKEQAWARLGVNVEEDFAPLYVVPKDKTKVVSQLKKLLKEVDELYLATDEDREGESISWHLVELLKPGKKPVRRMVFHEITDTAIKQALEHTRDIDQNLVKAQETRRVIDRLYGFTLSPLLWKKISYGLSAGRVQSPGLRLIVQREFERAVFKKSYFWDLLAKLSQANQSTSFEARLLEVAGRRIATGKDFDPDTGLIKTNKDLWILNEDNSKDLLIRLEKANWKVIDVQEKETTSKPAAPFITSTLQQEGNRKLGLSSRETMRMAQKLYEEGLITYMRTDSPNLSSQAIEGARETIVQLYGKDYLSPEIRQYSSKSASAQEAHEAIRPAGKTFVHPDKIELLGKEKALYELIWKRTIATQMADAKKAGVSVKIQAADTVFQANGTRIVFPGFLRAYVEGSDDPDQALEDKDSPLPALSIGEELKLNSLANQGHETKPPARYTEASLIQRLEKEGIGRPSTYASIISVLYERNYVRKQGTALVPSFTGISVAQFLETNFSELVEYQFTSSMESSLDAIALGQGDRSSYLKKFYLGEQGLKTQVDQREKSIKPEESRTVHLPQLQGFSDIKIGRFGPYVIFKDPESNQEIHASIPEDLAPAELTMDQLMKLIALQKEGGSAIGEDPETGLKVHFMIGRYGAYLQLGEASEDDKKPRRAPLPKDKTKDTITIEEALKALSLPRSLGRHPVSDKEITVNIGRFGPYVACDGEFRSLKKEDDVFTVTLSRVLEIMAEEKKGRAGSQVIKDLGSQEGTAFKLIEGRYGPYLKAGADNVSLSEEFKSPEGIEAFDLATALRLYQESNKKGAKSTIKSSAKNTAKSTVKTTAKKSDSPRKGGKPREAQAEE